MPFCVNCGKELNDEKYCPECGMPTDGHMPFNGRRLRYIRQKGTPASELVARAVSIVRQRPAQLWGVSLLFELLVILACVLGILPIISLPIALVLQMGMTAVYLAGYRGEEVKTETLFSGFSRFFKVAGGMGWMSLWILLWGMIPVVGPVFAVMKSYSYRFVPYILIANPELSAFEALRLSIQKTEGIKGKMFVADLIVLGPCILLTALFGVLTQIRDVGIVFAVIAAIFVLILALTLPLLMGLISAACYEELIVKESKSDLEVAVP